MTTLASLSRGFRAGYLRYDDLTAQLVAWRDAFPDLVRLRSLGTSPEGREIWLLTVGAEPDRVRPTVWVDGNLHAMELAGSSVALGIVEDVLAVHCGEGPELPAAVRDAVRRARFHVVPRISPDGAEIVLGSGRYVRSTPRDDRGLVAPRWVRQDIDGDGQVRMIRIEDPTGDYVAADPDHPDLLVVRDVGDRGPFYRVFPEGCVEPWDGFTVPAPTFLGDNAIDLNRQFPYGWGPVHEQVGAGRYPASEPESRAIVDFVTRSPEIVAWVDFHCYGGVFIRPLGDQPDSKMDQDDLAHYRQLAEWAKTHTGYPTVSGYHEFLYAPDQPLKGDLVDFAYHQRGAFGVTVELWDLFARLGLPKPEKFVDLYGALTREHLGRLATWDRDHNAGRVFGGWRPFDHPQLGRVEIGGPDARVGVWNPPPELLPEVCAGQMQVVARVAAMLPELAIREVRIDPAGSEVSRIEVRVDNLGYLPTHGLSSAKKLEWNEGLVAELAVAGGLALVDGASARVPVGHLAGWGRGLGNGGNEIAHFGSPGNDGSGRAVWFVRGQGSARIRVSAPRTGAVEREIRVGQ